MFFVGMPLVLDAERRERRGQQRRKEGGIKVSSVSPAAGYAIAGKLLELSLWINIKGLLATVNCVITTVCVLPGALSIEH